MIDVKEIYDEEVTILNPNNTVLTITNNLLTFTNIRLQIASKQLEGYSVKFRHLVIPIYKDGNLEIWPNGLFDRFEHLISELIDFQIYTKD